MIPIKRVYLKGRAHPLGVARTYKEVAQLLKDPRPDAAEQLTRECAEGPRSFHINKVILQDTDILGRRVP